MTLAAPPQISVSPGLKAALQGAIVTIRCKGNARGFCVACIVEAMHAPPVLPVLNAKANPKVLAQAAERPSPSPSV
jgi:hypothetical protein